MPEQIKERDTECAQTPVNAQFLPFINQLGMKDQLSK
jgi:hypothetical protein